MALYLMEVPLSEGGKEAIDALFKTLADTAEQANGERIEVKVSVDAGRVYAISGATHARGAGGLFQAGWH